MYRSKIELHNVDCLPFMKQCEDKQFDLAIVDPPYGLGDSVVNSGGRFKRYHNENGNWDKSIPTQEYFDELFRISKNQIVWGGNYFALPANKCFIIWDKGQPEGISFAMAEYAWASFDKVAQIFKHRTQGQKQRFHPTQKPIELYRWVLHNFAEKGQKIFDSHLGSGSIAVACDDMGFDLVACEIDSDYFRKASKRLDVYRRQQTLF